MSPSAPRCKSRAWKALSAVCWLALLVGGCTPPEKTLPDPDVDSNANANSNEAVFARPTATPVYLGADTCAGCHPEEHAAWRQSHHYQAMQTPSADTVLGDFAEPAFGDPLGNTRFDRNADGYLITTENANGIQQTFPVRYTFGVHPLQQYLLDQPDGRLQAFGLAWDARKPGGMGWFELYPGAGTSADVLHWTTTANNWNSRCADCHSTNLVKNYDPQTRRYDTTFSEINVACEACHGPAAGHHDASATPAASDGKLRTLDHAAQEIDACAPCHSRRAQLKDGPHAVEPFLDRYLPSLLAEGLYHSDGQILDEVYVYGSFLQSRMHARGVRCSDCHDPHRGTLKIPGDGTCTQCHNARGRADFPTLVPGNYDDARHHHHPPTSTGARCVNCHMPERTYMVVDPRRDHSLRVPRPDLSVALGVPNACNGCHSDQPPEWAVAQVAGWFGSERRPHFGTILAAAREANGGIAEQLAELAGATQTPAIVRATALELAAAYTDSTTESALLAGLMDTEPLVRIGALRGARRLPPRVRFRVAGGLLEDPLLAVRFEAVGTLAETYDALLPADRRRLHVALDEYLQWLGFNADWAETQTAMATVHAIRHQPDDAERALGTALEINPQWVPALINLADLYRSTGRDELGEALTRRALQLVPDNPDALLTRALWLVRQRRTSEALPLFASAHQHSGGSTRFAYVYAVALHDGGDYDGAMAILEAALERQPDHPQLLQAALSFATDAGDSDRARRYGDRLNANGGR